MCRGRADADCHPQTCHTTDNLITDMAYQVLARKWRPRNFPEMVGQAHVLQALTNALEHNRLHHAYLFTGTRGVGKTTIARILAKSLNCEKGVTADPCGTCAACSDIDKGRFVDLIEVDAASRTKVEDTRDLLDNVQYAPTQGRYKVYLIDEVHMLSSHSFNALLKTLEEPPSHVKFLLATTDPQKLPQTVLSRCLQFNLKRLPIEEISQHLIKVITAEGIQYEDPAINLLAKAADGSLRDALSLLDQGIAYGGGSLSGADMASMLGNLDTHVIGELIRLLAAKDGTGLLQCVAHLSEQNPDFVSVLGEILSLLQQIALAQVIPSDEQEIVQLAEQLSPEDVQLFYQIALIGRRDLPLSPEQRGGFEMVMLRMLTFRPEQQAVQTAQKPAPVSRSTPPPVQNAPNIQNATQNTESQTNDWGNIVQSLPLHGMLKQLAVNCALKQRNAKKWTLVLPLQRKSLFNKSREKDLEILLQKHLGEDIRVHIAVEDHAIETPAIQQQRVQENHQEYAATKINEEPFVNYMKEHCDARVVSINTAAQ